MGVKRNIANCLHYFLTWGDWRNGGGGERGGSLDRTSSEFLNQITFRKQKQAFIEFIEFQMKGLASQFEFYFKLADD